MSFIKGNKKALICLILPGFLFVTVLNKNNSPSILSDLFFLYGMIMISWGLFILVKNSGFFNGTMYGSRKFKDIMFKRKEFSASGMKEEYVGYVSERKQRISYSYRKTLPIGVLLVLLSVIFAVFN